MWMQNQRDGGVVVEGAKIPRFDAAFGAVDDYIGHTLLAGALGLRRILQITGH
jgi:hypothetical protein